MDIDEVVLNFNPASLMALDVVLALIMFGIALGVKVEDFKAVLKMPKAISVAIAAQFILLPAVTFGLTLLLQVGPSIALGMILVACCPPGNISQVLTNQARGNVALSASMTAVSNVLAIFLMPINFAFWGGLHPTAKEIFKTVNLDALDMLLKIVLIIGVPFAVGIFIAHLWPKFSAKVQPWVRGFSLVALLAFIVIALIGNWKYFIGFIGMVLLAVFLHDAIALALGWGTSKLFRLDSPSTKAVTFEVGIRNSGLGLGLVFAFFGGLGGMAVVAGWWGIWDIVAGLALASFWAARHKKTDAAPPETARTSA
ncbi:MAG: bile acid:sodium symporter family protein [Cryobacterium sp.]|nr:bile acid:sodium symporter family protein [Cryobacterium sp.]MCO5293792.1 bile acid:sodium symporter family protein [Homoserinimonas sp.]